MAAGGGGQGVAGACFEQDSARPPQDPERGVEPYGLAELAGPVLRRDGLLRCDPVTGQPGHPGQLRRAPRHGVQFGRELVEHRLRERRVEGARGVQQAASDRAGLQPAPHLRHRRAGAGQHAGRAAVDGGQVDALPGPAAGLVLGEVDGEHRAVRQPLHQPSAGRDQPGRVRQGEHPGQTGGRVLAQAVAQERRGSHPPGLPHPAQRVLHREQRGLRHVRPAEGVRAGGAPGCPGRPGAVLRQAERRGRIGSGVGAEQLRALVEVAPELRFRPVQLRGHARVLAALAGEQEAHRRFARRGSGCRFGRAQQLRGRRAVVADHRAPVREHVSAAQGVRHVREVRRRVAVEVLGQSVRRPAQGRLGAGGQGQQLVRPCRRPGRGRAGCLLQDHVRVGTAHAEGTDAGAPGTAFALPRPQLGVHEEGAVGEADRRIRAGDVQGRRDEAVLDGEHRLDQPGDAGRGVQVAQVRLHRAEGAVSRPGRGLGEGLREGGDLDAVAELRPRAVGLHEADRARRHPGHAEGLGDHLGLRVEPRGGESRLPRAVVVHRGALDDGVHVVAVGERVRQPLEDDDAEAVAGDGAARFGVEGPAVAVG